jgi:S-adenosyl methyltransferase
VAVAVEAPETPTKAAAKETLIPTAKETQSMVAAKENPSMVAVKGTRTAAAPGIQAGTRLAESWPSPPVPRLNARRRRYRIAGTPLLPGHKSRHHCALRIGPVGGFPCRGPARAIFATAVTSPEGASMSGTEQAAAQGNADGGGRRVIDTSVAHSARVHDYWLGGKDNFAADRAAGDAVIQAYPGIVASVRANRAFLARVVRFLAAEAGIRQFLDIGTGIPASNNTHEVAQSVAPGCRVVYVDYDPVVLLHAQALLTSSAQGALDYIDADLRDPEKLLAQAARTLDFSRPVAVMLIAIMHLIGDQDDPGGIIKQLMAAVPAGSYLALSQVASDIEAEQMAEAARRYNRLARETQRHRSHAEVTHFFDGLELLDPGVVPVPRWRPASELEAKARSAMWGGVALKR